ncbi:MAG TPA: translation initiation factor IF-2 [Kofleriaceae bacterium]|nr:translation initiation factor IF-2 [Kofleriaceae bacterium]
MAKIRVYELARELGLSSEQAVRELRARGASVRSHVSVIDAAAAEALKASLRADAERRARASVVVRRRPSEAPAAVPLAPMPPPAVAPEPPAPSPAPPAPPARTETRRPAQPAAPAATAVRVVEVAPARRPARGPGPRVRTATPKAAAAPAPPPAEHKRIVRIEHTISVGELARAVGVKATELLPRLWRLGMAGATINSSLDGDAAGVLASELGYEVRDVAFREDAVLHTAPDRAEDLVPRAPVITVMGHVDHGKTSLLDALRHTRVAAGESGGITQHIGASRVRASSGELIFIDTPGHAAFAAMRARGARATDLVVLAVAADDGVMPQTLEALDHAREARVPVLVAVTKCDLPAARPERVRAQLAEHGLIPEAWGGDVQYVDVSAWTGDGLARLVGAIAAQASLLDLRAHPRKPAIGVVLEARLDRGRGPVATVLVQQGTLRREDTIVCGEHTGRVRALFDDVGRAVAEAGPSTPVEVLGLGGVPIAGDPMHATDELTARRVAEHRREQRRRRGLRAANKISAETVLDKLRAGERPVLRLIVKADAQGTAEAVRDAVARLGTTEVAVEVVRAGVGAITESDVHLAIAAGARVIGFRVRPTGKAAALARHEGVVIEVHDVIYEALDHVRAAVTGLVPAVEHERALGRLEVRQVFRIPRAGTVAGCRVTEGTIRRGARVRVVRVGELVHAGRIASLRRFQDDVAEVGQGFDCGLAIERFDDVRAGDVIEVYETVRASQVIAQAPRAA